MGMGIRNTVKDIWNKIDKRGPDECWPWLAGLNAYGYGVVFWENKQRKVTRLLWFFNHGEWPGTELHVAHTCDHPDCCNPKHHFLATNEENSHDRHRKRRDSRGRKHSEAVRNGQGARLTEDMVRAMRRMREQGETYQAIAEAAGVSHGTAWRTVTGSRWGWLD